MAVACVARAQSKPARCAAAAAAEAAAPADGSPAQIVTPDCLPIPSKTPSKTPSLRQSGKNARAISPDDVSSADTSPSPSPVISAAAHAYASDAASARASTANAKAFVGLLRANASTTDVADFRARVRVAVVAARDAATHARPARAPGPGDRPRRGDGFLKRYRCRACLNLRAARKNKTSPATTSTIRESVASTYSLASTASFFAADRLVSLPRRRRPARATSPTPRAEPRRRPRARPRASARRRRRPARRPARRRARGRRRGATRSRRDAGERTAGRGAHAGARAPARGLSPARPPRRPTSPRTGNRRRTRSEADPIGGRRAARRARARRGESSSRLGRGRRGRADSRLPTRALPSH